MDTTRFTVQVTAYPEGRFAVALIRKTWRSGGWRAEKMIYTVQIGLDRVQEAIWRAVADAIERDGTPLVESYTMADGAVQGLLPGC